MSRPCCVTARRERAAAPVPAERQVYDFCPWLASIRNSLRRILAAISRQELSAIVARSLLRLRPMRRNWHHAIGTTRGQVLTAQTAIGVVLAPPGQRGSIPVAPRSHFDDFGTMTHGVIVSDQEAVNDIERYLSSRGPALAEAAMQRSGLSEHVQVSAALSRRGCVSVLSPDLSLPFSQSCHHVLGRARPRVARGVTPYA